MALRFLALEFQVLWADGCWVSIVLSRASRINLDLCATESNPLAKGPKPKVLFGVPGGEVRALGCRWPEDPADAHRAHQGPEPELFRPPPLAPEFLARSLGVSVGDGSEMF